MKMISLMMTVAVLTVPLRGAEIATTTAVVTVAGSRVTVNVSTARTPGYYRLAYDVASKKVKALVFSVGITETIEGLYCAETYAEVQAFAKAQGLAGLPGDPRGEPVNGNLLKLGR